MPAVLKKNKTLSQGGDRVWPKSTVVIETDRCKGCELCTTLCPQGILHMSREQSTFARLPSGSAGGPRGANAQAVRCACCFAPMSLAPPSTFTMSAGCVHRRRFHGKGAMGRQPGNCRSRHPRRRRGVLQLSHHARAELLEHMAAGCRSWAAPSCRLRAKSPPSIWYTKTRPVAGARAMSSSSSPGISLMQEGLSYIAASEVPVVLVDIMRGGRAWATSSRARAITSRLPAVPAGDFHPIVRATPASRKRSIWSTMPSRWPRNIVPSSSSQPTARSAR